MRDLLFPRECVSCARPGGWLCESCAGSMEVDPESSWLDTDDGPIRLICAAPYDGVAAAVVVAYKERGLRGLVDVLGALALRAGRRHETVLAGGTPYLVPVPTTWQARLRRGGDTWQQVCEVAFPASGIGPVCPALRWAGWVKPQKTLGKSARLTNVSGQLQVKRGWSGPARAIVADDVVTTGATVREAARALRRGGWEVVGAIAICG